MAASQNMAVQLASPSLPKRFTSTLIMGLTGVISKTVLYGFNSVEVTGLPAFLDLLDQRQDPERRQRGLITGARPPP